MTTAAAIGTDEPKGVLIKLSIMLPFFDRSQEYAPTCIMGTRQEHLSNR
jgi:hypothetical protein